MSYDEIELNIITPTGSTGRRFGLSLIPARQTEFIAHPLGPHFSILSNDDLFIAGLLAFRFDFNGSRIQCRIRTFRKFVFMRSAAMMAFSSSPTHSLIQRDVTLSTKRTNEHTFEMGKNAVIEIISWTVNTEQQGLVLTFNGATAQKKKCFFLVFISALSTVLYACAEIIRSRTPRHSIFNVQSLVAYI